jgi:hypothetical protein
MLPLDETFAVEIAVMVAAGASVLPGLHTMMIAWLRRKVPGPSLWRFRR